MKNWLIFFKERTPLASYLLITMGPVSSGYFLSAHPTKFDMFLSFLGYFLFFIVLRMMDEYKDYEKDILAHPTRPLPRGLIPLPQFKNGINLGIGLLITFDAFLFLLDYKFSTMFYTLIIIHLWLMYKEFYVAEWINARPLLYAVTHQLILVTLCLYCMSTYRNNVSVPFSRMDWVYSFSVLFAFFSYEVCRKLDPNAHPLLKTYRYIYGMGGVIKIVGVLLILHVFAIHYLFQENLNQYFFYITIVILLSGLLALNNGKILFKIVEHLATLNLIVFLYSGILYVLTN
jgi:hypothetical protein